MTEITDSPRAPTSALAPAVQQFVLHWGNLGDRWGVNRSVSQIHALLYVADRPLTAEEIADSLGIARSNVSNSLRELLAWDLIRAVPVLRDRRTFYVAETDLWTLVSRIAAGRKERELDPAVTALQACVQQAESDRSIHPVARKRLKEMLDFVETMDRWYAEMSTVPRPKLAALIRLGARIVRLLSLGKAERAARK